jgi:hypothetical protein
VRHVRLNISIVYKVRLDESKLQIRLLLALTPKKKEIWEKDQYLGSIEMNRNSVCGCV